MSNRNRPSGIERELRRRRKRRMAELNRNDHEIFTMMLKITLAALAVIIGICIWFWAAVQAHEVQAAVLRHHRITASSLIDIPLVEPLPLTPPEDGAPPQAIEIRTATKAEAVPEERWESIGRFKCTFYCPCRKCSGKWGYRTASGARCQENLTVAVDPKVIPLGTHLMINGREYIAQDTGVKGHWIDIFMESHQECLRNGVQYHEAFVRR